MKKTLVAVAAMAAVTGAMADGASLYGVIDQAYSVSKTTLGANQISSTTNLGAYQMGQSLLGVKGSEEFNGMKASYLYEFGLSTDKSATPTNRQSFVGLSGGFGALRVGKQYSQAFNNAVSADPLGATGGAGAIYLGVLTSYDSTSEFPLRQNKGIQFDLPNFVPGMNITLTKVLGNNNSAPANSSSTTANGQKTGDGSGFSINYTAGDFYAGYTTDSVNNTGVILGTNDDAGVTTAATANTIIAASTVNRNKISTTTLTYDLKVAKLGYGTSKVSVAAQSANTSMYSISAPLGNGLTALFTSSTGKIDVTGSTSDQKLKGQQYGFNYALSKRTTAYWHNGNHSFTNNTTGVAKKVTGYGIGLMHAF